VEPFLGRHPADAEEERRTGGDAEARAPKVPPRGLGRERRGVDAVGNHARDAATVAELSEALDALHELGRAAGEQRGVPEGSA
jgi:hypothetical protein